MKLLMVSGDRSILERKQGAFWYTLQELRKHWDRIDVICPQVKNRSNHGYKEIAGDSALTGGSVFFHPNPWSVYFQPSWIRRCGQQLVREYGHDVMTVHEYPPFFHGAGAERLAKVIGIPYALEIHHIVGYPTPADARERIGLLLSWLYLKRDSKYARGVRVVNKRMKEVLTQWGIPQEKIHIVPSFYLDPTTARTELRPPVSYDISFCARLVPNKGLLELIDVIKQLENARMLVIGEGPLRHRAEDLARHYGIDNRVTFLGWMPTQEAVLGAMQTARMFVVNSTSEGGPRVALEAMAAGMPVISTPVGVMPEVIQHGVNGLLTDGTQEDMIRNIKSLLSDDGLRDRLGEEAKNVITQFDRGTLVKGYSDFLKSLV